MQASNTISKMISSKKPNILTSIIVIFGISVVTLLSLSMFTSDKYVIYGAGALVILFALFFIVMYVVFAIKDPNRLHSESHIAQMAQIGLGSNNERTVSSSKTDSVIDIQNQIKKTSVTVDPS